MLENILGLVRSTVSGNIANNNQIPEEKKNQTIETTANAVADGLKQNISIANVPNLMSLFKNGASTQQNPITGSIQNTVINSLVQNVGLSKPIATTIAAAVVPMVLKAISGKVNDPNEKGFNLESLVHSFTGKENENTANGGNEVLGKLGKLFGK